MENRPLFPKEREKAILDIVRAKGRITAAELAEAFKTTKATIRRDLARLEAAGALTRTHGGALAVDLITTEYPLSERLTEHAAEKVKIAAAAVDLIADAKVIFLDAGTTTLMVARQLRERKGLTVITCSPDIAIELVRTGQVEIILTGGHLRPTTMSLSGPLAELTLEQLHADVAVLGMTAISARKGMFTVSPVDAQVKKMMLNHADRAIVVADSSKLGCLATCFVTHCSTVDYIVTDSGALPEELNALRGMGVKVLIANEKRSGDEGHRHE